MKPVNAGPGGVPIAVIAAIADYRDRIACLSAAAVVREATAFLSGIDACIQPVAALRSTTIKAMREAGSSYDQIAAAVGLSKARIAQLAAQAGRREA